MFFYILHQAARRRFAPPFIVAMFLVGGQFFESFIENVWGQFFESFIENLCALEVLGDEQKFQLMFVG